MKNKIIRSRRFLFITLMSLFHLPVMASPTREVWESHVLKEAKAFAEEDPVQAANWALGLEPDKKKLFALRIVFRHWANKEPEKAARWGQNIKDVAFRQLAVASAMSGWASSDEGVVKSIEWTNHLNDAEDRSNALYHLVFQWAYRAPVEAGALAIKSFPDQKKDLAIRHIASTWLEKTNMDAKPVLDWIVTLEDAELQLAAMDSIVHKSLNRNKWNPDKLKKQIQLIKNDKVKSNMLYGLVTSLASRHTYRLGYLISPFRAITPEGATEIAKNIPDTALRDEAIKYVKSAAEEMKAQ